MKRTHNTLDIAALLSALLVSFIILFPFFPLMLASFTGRFFLSGVNWHSFSLDRYFHTIKLMGYSYINSAIASIGAVALNLPSCTLAAYAFSRLRFRYKSSLQHLVIGVYAVPLVAGFVPLFIIFRWYGLINTLYALSLLGATISLPLNTWFAIRYFNTIPRELEESAMIDGCDRMQLLLKIILPLASPALVAMSIITFLTTWNEFMLAVIFLNKAENFTFTVALVTYGQGYQGTFEWGIISSGIIIGLFPVLLIYMLLHKYLITGLTGGVIKG